MDGDSDSELSSTPPQRGSMDATLNLTDRTVVC